jgi:hypothetical protein
MSTPTDEWLVTVLEDCGKRRRFVIHHPVGRDIAELTTSALQLAINTYSGGDFNAPGHWLQIVSIVNQEAP